MSLLDQARKHPQRGNSKAVSHDELELVLAWVRGEVTTAQCVAVTGTKKKSRQAGASQWHYHAACVIRSAVLAGTLTVSEVK